MNLLIRSDLTLKKLNHKDNEKYFNTDFIV